MGILTGGFVFLVGFWFPSFRISITHNKCPYKNAECVIVKSKVFPLSIYLVSSLCSH